MLCPFYSLWIFVYFLYIFLLYYYYSAEVECRFVGSKSTVGPQFSFLMNKIQVQLDP